MPQLLDLMLAQEADPVIGLDCPCGWGVRSTQCHDCLLYEAACPHCFIAAHRSRPTHWARVWDFDKGFFVRHDISTVLSSCHTNPTTEDQVPSSYTIHLGHHGHPCPNPMSGHDLIFYIVDCNGVHNTKLRFCMCPGALPERWQQLMSH